MRRRGRSFSSLVDEVDTREFEEPFRKRWGFFIALFFVYYIKIKASLREVQETSLFINIV